MIITYSLSSRRMIVTNGGKWELEASCLVRNEVNGWRKNTEIVKTIPEGRPYQPRQFPVGVWKVGRPVARTEPYKAPIYIPTNAWREVRVWRVVDGEYHHPTDDMVIDTAYGLHCSTSNTTLGCIKIHRVGDLYRLASEIFLELDRGHEPVLEVEY